MARADVRSLLLAHSQAIDRVGGVHEAALLRSVADVCAPQATLVELKGPSPSVGRGSDDQSDTLRVATVVRDLIAVLNAAARKDVLADLGRLADFLERHAKMTLKDLLVHASDKQPDDLIASYAEQLSAAYGNTGFEELLEEVMKDRRVKQTDLVEIVTRMGKRASGKESKKVISERLLDLHRSLMTFKAKERAMEGRSAA